MTAVGLDDLKTILSLNGITAGVMLKVIFTSFLTIICLGSCHTVIIPDHKVQNELNSNLNFSTPSSENSIPEKLTLHLAREAALKGNPGLQAAELRILRARAIVRQAKSLYFPTLNATVGARHQHHVPKGQFGFSTASYENYRSALTSQWLIFDGFAREFKVLAAKYGELATKESYNDSQRMLLDAVSQSFYQTILALKEMEINHEIKEINLKFLQDSEIKMKAGTVGRTEVNNFKVNVNDAEIAYLEAKNNFEISKIILAELLGAPEASLEKVMPVFKIFEVSVPEEKTAIQIALNKRPDIKALQAEILALEAQIKEARGEYFPKFYLEGSYGTSSFERAEFGDDKRDSYLGATMSWDLFTGNSTAGLIAQRKAEKGEKLKLLKSQWFQTVSEIRQQRKSLLNVIEKLEVQTRTEALSKSIYEDTKVIFDNGATTITRVNEVLTNYSVAKLNKVLFEIEAVRRRDILNSLMGINLK